jgi:pyruvate formate-lyase activating enzyme-like uncharacterized protein
MIYEMIMLHILCIFKMWSPLKEEYESYKHLYTERSIKHINLRWIKQAGMDSVT